MAGPIYEFSNLPQANAAAATPRNKRVRQPGDAPSVGVIYNPRSHRNKGQDLDSEASPHVFIVQPGDRENLPQALETLAQRDIDLLVINGGDGTVRDVLTCGRAIFGDHWPAIAVLPKGKTNALTVDFDAPGNWSLQEAIEAFDSGRRICRRPIEIAPLDQPGSALWGFIMGAGAFTLGIRAGQDAHRLGAFNSLAVGVTSLWGAAQALFGTDRNPWRRGVEMAIRLGEDRASLHHSGHGDPARREILIASTLERFPAGTRPFGKLTEGLKLAVMDKPRRRLLALLPAIAYGWSNPRLRAMGLHQVTTPFFEMDLTDQFILDGEAFPAGSYRVGTGPELEFVAP